MSFNNFKGAFPSSLYYCKKLVTLKMRENQLEGSLATTVGEEHEKGVSTPYPVWTSSTERADATAWESLVVFDAGANAFTGPIPAVSYPITKKETHQQGGGKDRKTICKRFKTVLTLCNRVSFTSLMCKVSTSTAIRSAVVCSLQTKVTEQFD